MMGIASHMTRTSLMRIAMALVAVVMHGCASLPPGSVRDPGDPFERYNRAAFSFNDAVDRAVLKPVAQAYEAVTPSFLRQAVGNFFDNLSDVSTVANDLLQGKPKMAATHTGRLAVNSTFGLLGLIDVATPMGLERQREDFGQTLGVWGFESGPYLVLPLLGPSSIHDTAGLSVDFATDPVFHLDGRGARAATAGPRAVNGRSRLLEAETTLKEIAFDPYLFTRDAYLTRRRSAVHDGDPPERKEKLPQREADEEREDQAQSAQPSRTP